MEIKNDISNPMRFDVSSNGKDPRTGTNVTKLRVRRHNGCRITEIS